MRHILSLLVENEAGALSRISGLFSARAFNIESLTVAPTEDESLSRMTIVTTGSEQIIEQITKQVNKLVDVIKVVDLNERAYVERELLLIKLDADKVENKKLESIVSEYKGSIIDESENTFMVEIINTGEVLDNVIENFDQSWILEVVRSGVSGIALGASVINK